MSKWDDLPSEIRKIIITMGKEIVCEEFLSHQELFQNCLFDIIYRTDRTMHICMRLARIQTCPLNFSSFY